MEGKISQAQQRAVQYWFVDGLAEAGAGLISLLLAAGFLIWPVLPKSQWSLLLFFGSGLAASVSLRLAIQRMKERSTYPRTGYAAPLGGLENRRAAAAAVVFTILLLAVNAYLTISGLSRALWSPVIPGLIFAFLFAWTGWLVKLRRFFVLALLSLLGGAVLAFFQTRFFTAAGLQCGLSGMVLLLQGFRTRREYLGR